MKIPAEKTILVTGDPICDHNYYRGHRATADSADERGFRLTRTRGGAILLNDLIVEATAQLEGWKTEFGLKVDHEELPQSYHAFCLWEAQVSNPFEKDAKKRVEVWRAVEPPLGYGQPAKPHALTRPVALGHRRKGAADPEIVVIDDAGLAFRDGSSRDHWPLRRSSAKTPCPRWIVLKLSGAVGEGDLWPEIAAQCADNLIIIVSADQLRRGDVRISRGLSWEATVEDLRAELDGNIALRPLLKARHLIVTFQSDGAFWLDNEGPQARRAMLVFDAANAEGDWGAAQGKGGVFGYLSCFTTAVVAELCRGVDERRESPDLEKALSAGLSASRELRRLGHGRVQIKAQNDPDKVVQNPSPGFPFQAIAAQIADPTDRFVSARLPAVHTNRGKWMLLDEWQAQAHSGSRARPQYEAAMAVAVLGPTALDNLPVARFGALLTVDREEIESLRSLRRLITSYEKAGPQNKPLSIGVFGPPGAGKSFGVMQIAKAVLGEKVEPLTFNLSQFSDPAALNGAFHQVRDKVLAGVTPVVFWDEFDSQDYRWLQYLLAPMQDGTFQETQLNHPIGKCVFIFAGATSSTFQHFGPPDPGKADARVRPAAAEKLRDLEHRWSQFVLRKGPDFRSRLSGYLNVLGPNPRQACDESGGSRHWADDPVDRCFPIRRALFIRNQFKLQDQQRLSMDQGVLRALLEIPRYKAGARSLEFLCQQLRAGAAAVARRSQLPGHGLLDMHVDAARFWQLCERDLLFRASAPGLAICLHEAYRLRIKGRPEKKHLDVPFAQLDEDMRAANLEQALRVNDNLRLAGLTLKGGNKIVALTDLAAARLPSVPPSRSIPLPRLRSSRRFPRRAIRCPWEC